MPLLTQDRDLLRAFKAGDSSALERVYRHYAPEVLRYLTRGFSFNHNGSLYGFVGFARPSDVEGALQQIFVHAFGESARSAYDGLRPFGAYLLTIARNHVVSEYRRARVAAELFVSDPETVSEGSSGARTAPSLHEELEQREVGRLLEQFRHTLSELETEVFVLRFEQELSQNEAAAQMDLTRIRLRRIEAKLKHRLLKHLKAAGYLEGVLHAHLGNDRLRGS